MNYLGNRTIMGKNISYYMNVKGIDRTQLAKDLGIPYTTLTDWIKGKTYPRIDKIEQMANYFGINKADLVEARSASNDTAPSWATPLVDAYAATTRPKQEAVCTVLDIPHVVPGEVLEEEEKVAPDPFNLAELPVSAGTGVYLGPEEFDTIWVEHGCLPRNHAFGVRVSGDSMEPKYHDGDILIVGKEKACRSGQIAIFTMDGTGYVKVLRNGYLKSLNNKYDDIPMTEDIICNGLVIGVLDKDCILEEE